MKQTRIHPIHPFRDENSDPKSTGWRWLRDVIDEKYVRCGWKVRESAEGTRHQLAWRRVGASTNNTIFIHLDLLLLAFQRNEHLCSAFHFVIHLCQLLWSVPQEDVNGWYTSIESCSLIPSYLLHSVGGCEIIPIFICIASLILAYPMNICPFSSSFPRWCWHVQIMMSKFSSIFTSLVYLCPTNVYPFSHLHRSGFVCCLQHPRWMRCFCYVFSFVIPLYFSCFDWNHGW